MGNVIWRGRCSECGEERGWTYARGILTQWKPRREWDTRVDPTRILVCGECGSEHPVHGSIAASPCPRCGGTLGEVRLLRSAALPCPRCTRPAYRFDTEMRR